MARPGAYIAPATISIYWLGTGQPRAPARVRIGLDTGGREAEAGFRNTRRSNTSPHITRCRRWAQCFHRICQPRPNTARGVDVSPGDDISAPVPTRFGLSGREPHYCRSDHPLVSAQFAERPGSRDLHARWLERQEGSRDPSYMSSGPPPKNIRATRPTQAYGDVYLTASMLAYSPLPDPRRSATAENIRAREHRRCRFKCSGPGAASMLLYVRARVGHIGAIQRPHSHRNDDSSHQQPDRECCAQIL